MNNICLKLEKCAPKDLKKCPNLPILGGYFSLNKGHSDPLFCMQIDVVHRGHNHPTWITSASNWRNVPPKTLKSVQICLFLGYFSVNISHSDLLFCMQVDVPHRGYNHSTWITSASNCRNMPPMLTDGQTEGRREGGTDGRTDDRRGTLYDCVPRLTQVSQKSKTYKPWYCSLNQLHPRTSQQTV
jgi:hypothetical protein